MILPKFLTRLLLGSGRCVEQVRKKLKALVPSGSILYRLLRYPSMKLRAIFPELRRFTGDGIFCREEDLWMCSLYPIELLKAVVYRFRPDSLLDCGCGTGKSLDFFLSEGIAAVGIEGSTLARAKALHPEKIILKDLRKAVDLGTRFDVVWCFEVVEHLPAQFAETLVRTMVTHAGTVVLSAARPGQGGECHFNEQPPEYWIEKFGHFDFALDNASTSALQRVDNHFGPNILVFKKRTDRI